MEVILPDPFPGWGTLGGESMSHGKAAATHYGLEPCGTPNCSWCDPKGAMEAMGGLERLAVELNPTDEHGNPLPYPVSDITDPVLRPGVTLTPDSNRFDPYEALEVIDRMNLVTDVQNACTVIHEQVGLLRAYITGMER